MNQPLLIPYRTHSFPPYYANLQRLAIGQFRFNELTDVPVLSYLYYLRDIIPILIDRFIKNSLEALALVVFWYRALKLDEYFDLAHIYVILSLTRKIECTFDFVFPFHFQGVNREDHSLQ